MNYFKIQRQGDGELTEEQVTVVLKQALVKNAPARAVHDGYVYVSSHDSLRGMRSKISNQANKILKDKVMIVTIGEDVWDALPGCELRLRLRYPHQKN